MSTLILIRNSLVLKSSDPETRALRHSEAEFRITGLETSFISFPLLDLSTFSQDSICHIAFRIIISTLQRPKLWHLQTIPANPWFKTFNLEDIRNVLVERCTEFEALIWSKNLFPKVVHFLENRILQWISMAIFGNLNNAENIYSGIRISKYLNRIYKLCIFDTFIIVGQSMENFSTFECYCFTAR